MTRRAKIVCTLGPATQSPERIRALVEAGMDVARLNFSHGTCDDHANVYRLVREASDATGRAVGVLVDLQGPKIRLGRFERGTVRLVAGDEFEITTEPVEGDWRRAALLLGHAARLPGGAGDPRVVADLADAQLHLGDHARALANAQRAYALQRSSARTTGILAAALQANGRSPAGAPILLAKARSLGGEPALALR